MVGIISINIDDIYGWKTLLQTRLNLNTLKKLDKSLLWKHTGLFYY